MSNVNVNISQTLVGSVDIEQGDNVVYKVRVANVPYTDSDNVQHSADGLWVQSVLPVGVVPVSWAATYSSGATGPASGTGALSMQITTLAPGAYVNVTVTAKVGLGTNPPATLKLVSFVTAPSAFCIVPTAKDSVFTEFSVIRTRVDVSLEIATSGTYVRGREADFIMTFNNDSGQTVNSIWVDALLPDGVYLKSWTAALTSAFGQTYGTCLPGVLNEVLNGGTVIYTGTVLIGPDAVLGGNSITAKAYLPSDLNDLTGSNCLTATLDFTVTDPVTDICMAFSNCVSNLVCDDVTAITGYALVSLISPDRVVPKNLVSKKPISLKTYRFNFDEDGCWVSDEFPVNTFLITKCTGEPIPSYYHILEYVNGLLQGQYKIHLDADTTYGSDVNVVEWNEN